MNAHLICWDHKGCDGWITQSTNKVSMLMIRA